MQICGLGDIAENLIQILHRALRCFLRAAIFRAKRLLERKCSDGIQRSHKPMITRAAEENAAAAMLSHAIEGSSFPTSTTLNRRDHPATTAAATTMDQLHTDEG